MNKNRTCADSDANLTRPRSGPVRGRLCIVRDPNDRPWGPFTSAGEATAWAEKKWPGVPQRDGEGYDSQGGFWDIEDIWAPD